MSNIDYSLSKLNSSAAHAVCSWPVMIADISIAECSPRKLQNSITGLNMFLKKKE
jgi:hypothetical protein